MPRKLRYHSGDVTKLRWQHYLIAIVVATQMLIPLHYYLARRDPHDERFAWRMFSPMRMVQCRPQFTKADRPVVLGVEFHEAWVELASRGRFAVLEAMGARLCQKYPNTEIRLDLTCKYIDGSIKQYGGYDICQVPAL